MKSQKNSLTLEQFVTSKHAWTHACPDNQPDQVSGSRRPNELGHLPVASFQDHLAEIHQSPVHAPPLRAFPSGLQPRFVAKTEVFCIPCNVPEVEFSSAKLALEGSATPAASQGTTPISVLTEDELLSISYFLGNRQIAIMTAVTKEGPWASLLSQRTEALKRQCASCVSSSEAPLAALTRPNTARFKGRQASNRVVTFEVEECCYCGDSVCDLCRHNFGGECAGEGGVPCPDDEILCPKCCFSNSDSFGMCRYCASFPADRRSIGMSFRDFANSQLGDTPSPLQDPFEVIDPLQSYFDDGIMAACWSPHLMPDQCSGTKSSTLLHSRTTVVSSFWDNLSSSA